MGDNSMRDTCDFYLYDLPFFIQLHFFDLL